MSNEYTLLLGDNPFFGVDHLSQERSRLKAKKSQKLENIVNVIEHALELGVNKMVISTHPGVDELLNVLNERGILKKMEFFPNIPYAQGYVAKINESGITSTVFEILNSLSFKNKIKIITKGGLGAIRKDLFSLFKVFVDLELLKMKNTKMKTIFLHDVLTDLALSLNMKNIFSTFSEYIHDNYKLETGLITKNFPLLALKLDEWDLQFSEIMTSFNKVGFQMNPSREECETALSNYKGDVIAMSVLAGGYLDPKSSFEYIKSQKNIKKVVIGMSSIEHVDETIEIFQGKN